MRFLPLCGFSLCLVACVCLSECDPSLCNASQVGCVSFAGLLQPSATGLWYQSPFLGSEGTKLRSPRADPGLLFMLGIVMFSEQLMPGGDGARDSHVTVDCTLWQHTGYHAQTSNWAL